jgi:hypothetical protein
MDISCLGHRMCAVSVSPSSSPTGR